MSAQVLFLLTLASSVPTLNLEASCRAAQSSVLAEDRAGAYEACMHDEQTARQQLMQKWARIPSAARQSCIDEATGISPSYVELLTCLEMRTGGNFSGATPVPDTPAPDTEPPAGAAATGAGSSAPAAVPGAGAPNAAAPPPVTSGGIRVK